MHNEYRASKSRMHQEVDSQAVANALVIRCVRESACGAFIAATVVVERTGYAVPPVKVITRITVRVTVVLVRRRIRMGFIVFVRVEACLIAFTRFPQPLGFREFSTGLVAFRIDKQNVFKV